ncbi:MAG: hypothetical protein N4A45_10550 [Flavobacteriales bacterium]|jgi:hypothetical protein|nr:hypothetical protein [Flavobacteriales bacterium]
MKNLLGIYNPKFTSPKYYSFKGSRKEVLEHLRQEAKRKRRDSRLTKGLPDNVHSIDENLHQAKLVTIASFKINEMGLEQLLDLLNQHGELKYAVEEIAVETTTTIKEVKKALNITDTDIASYFGYSSLASYANASRKKFIEKGIIHIFDKINNQNG